MVDATTGDGAVRAAAAASSAGPADAIVGNWTGEAATPGERAGLDLAHLRRRVRSVAVECLRRRETWARQNGEVNTARAVAYQSVAGLLQQALEDNEARRPTTDLIVDTRRQACVDDLDQRLRTTFAVEVVTARLIHDSKCPAFTNERWLRTCTCDLPGTAHAGLSALIAYVLRPDQIEDLK